jgi:hypothetical protein
MRLRLLFGAVIALTILIALDLMAFRPWRQHWGASAGEIARSMPGDDRVSDPDEVTTRAISIRAAPRHVWPWLAQMGRGRGGLYSYDALDRMFGILDQPSSKIVLPQFQKLAAGDTIPVGGGASWPVAMAKPGRILLIDVDEADVRVTWVFEIDSLGPDSSRLVTRVRARLPHTWSSPFMRWGLDHAEFIMVRRQLLNLRERAERLAGRP